MTNVTGASFAQPAQPLAPIPITLRERPQRCDPALLDRVIEYMPERGHT